MKRILCPIGFLLLGLASGCGGPDLCITPEFGCNDVGGGGGAVSFEKDAVPLLGNGCGLSGCHMNPGEDNFTLDLVALDCNGFYTNLTADRVAESTTGPRLDPATDPSDPANTFFILKGNGQLNHIADYLNDTQSNLLINWVSQGAENDCS